MVYTLLSFGIIVILMAGMILAAKMRPPADKADGSEKAMNKRLEIIRKSSLLR